MHAFLLIGKGGWGSLAKKLKAEILEFPVQKIDDVRDLNSLIRLTFKTPTLIVCENINDATEEALNAFLKNLEEPQENIYFALTAPSVKKVMPTIVSRCQIIRNVTKDLEISTTEVKDFLVLNVEKKLEFIDGIKKRDDAVEFVENVINYLNTLLSKESQDYIVIAKNTEAAIKALAALKANGNINLQLSNFVIGLQY